MMYQKPKILADGSSEYKGFIYKKNRGYYYRNVETKLTRQHREVYEDFYGEIPAGFVVHHKDGNKANNDPENLVLMKRGSHSALHNTGREHTEEELKKMNKKPIPIPEPYSN